MDNMRDSCYDPKMMNLYLRKPKGILQFGSSSLTRETGGIVANVQKEEQEDSVMMQLQRQLEEHKFNIARLTKTRRDLKEKGLKGVKPHHDSAITIEVENPGKMNKQERRDLEKREKAQRKELLEFYIAN
jgi:hypothetical protein